MPLPLPLRYGLARDAPCSGGRRPSGGGLWANRDPPGPQKAHLTATRLRNTLQCVGARGNGAEEASVRQ